MADKGVIYRLRIYAPPSIDAIKALRRLLKMMLRQHGLRVLSIDEENNEQCWSERS